MLAAISPVVYIWETLGETIRPFSANFEWNSFLATIVQSCSPVVST